MPSYKLTYFNARGAAEPLRFLFAYAGVDYDDVRVERENWPALKPSFTFGQLPVLEIDGKQYNQSTCCARYLAKQFKLAGENDLEDLEINAIVDTIVDFRTKLSAVVFEQDEAVKAKKMKQIKEEIIPFYLERLEGVAKKNNGHLALGKLTWADFYLAAQIDTWNSFSGEDMLGKHPNLQQVVTNVKNLPKIKEWVAKRPETQF